MQDFSESCARREQWRALTDKDVHTPLRGLLDIDKRSTSSAAGGLAMQEDFPSFQPLSLDRLEPNDSLPDICLCYELNLLFVRVLFWRSQVGSLAHHQNPLFSAETGVSHEQAALNWLHTLSLGACQNGDVTPFTASSALVPGARMSRQNRPG